MGEIAKVFVSAFPNRINIMDPYYVLELLIPGLLLAGLEIANPECSFVEAVLHFCEVPGVLIYVSFRGDGEFR